MWGLNFQVFQLKKCFENVKKEFPDDFPGEKGQKTGPAAGNLRDKKN